MLQSYIYVPIKKYYIQQLCIPGLFVCGLKFDEHFSNVFSMPCTVLGADKKEFKTLSCPYRNITAWVKGSFIFDTEVEVCVLRELRGPAEPQTGPAVKYWRDQTSSRASETISYVVLKAGQGVITEVSSLA